MDESVSTQMESLRQRNTKELKERFRKLFGTHSPSSNHTHLFRRLAWHLQSQHLGSLSDRALVRAFQLTADGYPHLPLPKSHQTLRDKKPVVPEKDLRLPPVGTSLARSYQGKLITVTVLENGFEYNGKIYASLSAIAYRVTGTRWNGLHFFGLKSPWGAPPNSAVEVAS